MTKLIAKGVLVDTADAKIVAVVYKTAEGEAHVKLYRKEFNAAPKTEALKYEDMIDGATTTTVPAIEGGEAYDLEVPASIQYTDLRAVPAVEDGKVNLFARMRYTVAAPAAEEEEGEGEDDDGNA